jgi:sialidase-1
MKRCLLAAWLGLFFFGAGLQAAPLFETQTIFPFAPNNRPNYRIPALAFAPNGDLLAIAERRNDGIGDIGDHDLVLRRSSDGGRTWGPIELIFADGGRDCTDATVCIDAERRRIFLLFLRDKKRFAYLSSDDSGGSWHGPVMIHEAVTRPEWDRLGLDSAKPDASGAAIDPESHGQRKVKEWSKNWNQRYGVGPGAGGVQLTKGAHQGRLLVGARHKEKDADGKTVGYSHVIYSDDHGESWHLGPNVIRNGNECRLVELPDGDVMMNARNANPADEPDNSRRLVSVSHDGGDTWDPAYRDDALVSTTVHAGLRVYRHAGSPNDGILLFSNPASPIRTKQHPYGRYNLTVRWSRDSGQTWSAGRPIYPHPCSYSDMAILPDGTVAIVYERSPKGSDHYWDEVQFARFNLDWLLAPAHTPIP